MLLSWTTVRDSRAAANSHLTRGRSRTAANQHVYDLGACGKIRRSPPMKSRLIAPALALAVLTLVSSRAEAGLFSHHGPGCGCEPACGAPAAGCCDAGPSCCGHGHRGLLSCLFNKPHFFGGCGHQGCCDPGPSCGCAPAPSCGLPAEPACGCEPSCGYAEPVCGSAPVSCCPAPRRCGGLLQRLFAHKHHCGSCGCAPEPACGCEPSCGCR